MRKAAVVLALAIATVDLAFAQTGHLRADETIAKLNLPESELTQVISGVEAAAFDSPDSWEKELRARRISLGAAPGLVLRGLLFCVVRLETARSLSSGVWATSGLRCSKAKRRR